MLDRQIITIILAAVCSFALALLAGRLVIPALRALKAGQSIREIGPSWHKTKSGTPTMGGVIFISGLLLIIPFGWRGMRSGDWTHLLVLGFSLVFGVIGFIDDFFKVKYKRNLGLTALQKLLLQLAASVLYIYILYRLGELTSELYVPFFNVWWKLPLGIYIALAVFIIVGCVNAVNLTDGIDGLAAGVTLPVMLFFTVVCVSMQKLTLGLFPACLLGGLAGFLCYNFHPAKVFMGDTGSLFLGAAVCGMAFAVNLPLILILVGVIYIVETLSVIMQVGYFKLTHGKRIFRMTPIHHHFEMGGWSEIKIFFVFTLITCAACVLAWFGIAPLR